MTDQIKYCYDCGYPHTEKFNCPKCGNSLYTEKPNRRTTKWGEKDEQRDTAQSK